jgi:hypothetical protein
LKLVQKVKLFLIFQNIIMQSLVHFENKEGLGFEFQNSDDLKRGEKLKWTAAHMSAGPKRLLTMPSGYHRSPVVSATFCQPLVTASCYCGPYPVHMGWQEKASSISLPSHATSPLLLCSRSSPPSPMLSEPFHHRRSQTNVSLRHPLRVPHPSSPSRQPQR